jgi:hypothetical protein
MPQLNILEVYIRCCTIDNWTGNTKNVTNARGNDVCCMIFVSLDAVARRTRSTTSHEVVIVDLAALGSRVLYRLCALIASKAARTARKDAPSATGTSETSARTRCICQPHRPTSPRRHACCVQPLPIRVIISPFPSGCFPLTLIVAAPFPYL